MCFILGMGYHYVYSFWEPCPSNVAIMTIVGGSSKESSWPMHYVQTVSIFLLTLYLSHAVNIIPLQVMFHT